MRVKTPMGLERFEVGKKIRRNSKSLKIFLGIAFQTKSNFAAVMKKLCFFGPLNRPKICELQVFTHVINATRAFCARRNCYGFTAILVLANDLLPPERQREALVVK